MVEAGQILHGNVVNHSIPTFVYALLSDMRERIGEAFRRVYQSPWGFEEGALDPWFWNTPGLPQHGTGIPGVEWRPYYNWAGCPGDEDWDEYVADLPNFAFEGVEIRWYKRFGRSMNANVQWSANRWVQWYDRFVQTLHAFEDERCGVIGGRIPADPYEYPNPDDRVPLDSDLPA